MANLAERLDGRLMCSVDRIEHNFRTHEGRIYFPPDNCCDMTGAIALFTAVDPKVRVIYTFAGGVPDTLYRLDEGAWTALVPADPHERAEAG